MNLARTYHIIKNGMTFKNVCRHLWGKVHRNHSGRLYIALTFRCNLNCPYCVAKAHLGNNLTRKELSGKEWVRIINRYDRDVHFTGGEPTLHKDIWYILQNIKPSLQVKLNTNMTFDVDEFLDKVKRPVYLCASYHPVSGPPQKIIDRILKLKQVGKWDLYSEIHAVGLNVNATREFEEAGIKLTVNPLFTLPKKDTATKRVLCKHYGFVIGPDSIKRTCHSKMWRGLGLQENLVTGRLKGAPTITKCNDYPFCSECDFRWSKVTEIKATKLHLQNGACEGRYSCTNNNSNVCWPLPKQGEDFIRCDYYERGKS